MTTNLNVQIARSPHPDDNTVYNYGGSDIAAYTVVALDVTNAINSTNYTNEGVGVVLPSGAGGKVIGITVETIKAGGTGRISSPGPWMWCTATSAITAGAIVMSDGAGTPGNVITQTSGLFQLGIALTGAVNAGDPILILMCFANNA